MVPYPTSSQSSGSRVGVQPLLSDGVTIFVLQLVSEGVTMMAWEGRSKACLTTKIDSTTLTKESQPRGGGMYTVVSILTGGPWSRLRRQHWGMVAVLRCIVSNVHPCCKARLCENLVGLLILCPECSLCENSDHDPILVLAGACCAGFFGTSLFFINSFYTGLH